MRLNVKKVGKYMINNTTIALIYKRSKTMTDVIDNILDNFLY